MKKDKMTFEELKELYSKENIKCKTLGKIYLPYKMELVDINCNKWFCKKCRPIKKFELYLDILRYVYIYNLQKHFIITCEGEKFRKICDYDESYYFMSKQWDNFKKCIERKYGGFSYIALARSQKDGYSHFHILINKYIHWNFLNEKRKKYGLGYISIQKNKDVAEYLNTDFFKNHEWIIPLNIRHFKCSRNIKLNACIGQSEKLIFFGKKTEEEIKTTIYGRYGDIYDFNQYYESKLIIKHKIFCKIKEMNEKEIKEEIIKW